MSWNPQAQPLVPKNRKRVERSINIQSESGITIETAVFVDAFLYSHMARTNFPDDTEQEMTHFVLAMINAVISRVYYYHPESLSAVHRMGHATLRKLNLEGLFTTRCDFAPFQVQLLYQDDSLGREIDFQVQRLEMWTRQPLDLLPILAVSSSGTTTAMPGKQGIHDIDRYLNRFWSAFFFFVLFLLYWIANNPYILKPIAIGKIEKILVTTTILTTGTTHYC
jgi:hypothetical protein